MDKPEPSESGYGAVGPALVSRVADQLLDRPGPLVVVNQEPTHNPGVRRVLLMRSVSGRLFLQGQTSLCHAPGAVPAVRPAPAGLVDVSPRTPRDSSPEPTDRPYTRRHVGRNYFLAPAQASARLASSETLTPRPLASRTTLFQLGLRRPCSTWLIHAWMKPAASATCTWLRPRSSRMAGQLGRGRGHRELSGP